MCIRDSPSPLYDWNEIASELAWWRPLVLGQATEEASGGEEPRYIEPVSYTHLDVYKRQW